MKICQKYLKGPLHALICPYTVFISVLIRCHSHIEIFAHCLGQKTLVIIFYIIKAEKTHSHGKLKISCTKAIKITLKPLSQILVRSYSKSYFVLSFPPHNEVSWINSCTKGSRRGQRWPEFKWHLSGALVKCWPSAHSKFNALKCIFYNWK